MKEFERKRYRICKVPFSIVLTAKSFGGNAVTDFNDIIDMSGWVGTDGGEQEIGNGTTAEQYPISVYYKKKRTQMIYLSSNIGRAGTISDLCVLCGKFFV